MGREAAHFLDEVLKAYRHEADLAEDMVVLAHGLVEESPLNEVEYTHWLPYHLAVVAYCKSIVKKGAARLNVCLGSVRVVEAYTHTRSIVRPECPAESSALARPGHRLRRVVFQMYASTHGRIQAGRIQANIDRPQANGPQSPESEPNSTDPLSTSPTAPKPRNCPQHTAAAAPGSARSGTQASVTEGVDPPNLWLQWFTIRGGRVVLGDGSVDELRLGDDGMVFLGGGMLRKTSGDRMCRMGKSGVSITFVRCDD